jgi:hypothetical protein
MELTSELEKVEKRVEKLERQVRWMKLGGLSILLLVASVLVGMRLTNRARASSIVTTDLVLQDRQGRKRAELSTDKDSLPYLVLFGMEEGREATLSPDRMRFEFGAPGSSGKTSTSLGFDGLYAYDDHDKEVFALAYIPPLSAPAKKEVFLNLFSPDKQQVWLAAGDDGPVVGVRDDGGFSAALGRSDLETIRTGETHKTSAASLTLFGKNKKVIWSAP